MNMLQFSARQLTIIISSAVVASLTVYTLGVLTGTAIAEPPRHSAIERIAEQPANALPADACIELPLQATAAGPAEDPAALDAPVAIEPPAAIDRAERLRYGIQVAVFEQLDNAIAFVQQHRGERFAPRIFRRAEAQAKSVYPVLVGLYDTMDAAQQAKHAFNRQSAIEAFVTDASRLQEEIVRSQIVAMAN